MCAGASVGSTANIQTINSSTFSSYGYEFRKRCCHRPVTAASPRTRSMHRRTSCHRGVTGPSPLCHRTPIKWIRRARCHRPVTTPSPLCHRARACGFVTRSVTAASPRCHQYVTTHFRSWKSNQLTVRAVDVGCGHIECSDGRDPDSRATDAAS